MVSKRPNSRSRKVLVLGAAVVILVLSGWAGHLLIQRRGEQRLDANLETIQALLALPDQSQPDAQFDRVRQFIHRNSRHGAGAEFRSVLGDKNLVAERMIAHATGWQNSEPVELLCGARSNMMSAVLNKLGFETRIIALFDTDDDGLRSHTFLEVKNPETGRWETQDPDFDLYWVSKNSGSRISLADAAENLSDLEPCHKPGACGWELDSDEGKSAARLRDYLDIISIDKKLCRATTRAKLDRVFTRNGKDGRFADLVPNRCLAFEPALGH
jgi:hypothetical protein